MESRRCPGPALGTPAEASTERIHTDYMPRLSDGQPVALAVTKRGRRCIVGKITYLDGRPILAIVWRNQHGTERCVSVPTAALEYAEAHNCRWLYVRDDRRLSMGRVPLANVRGGWLGRDGERYVRLDDLERVQWEPWPFAEHVIDLPTLSPSSFVGQLARQLALWGTGEQR